MEGSKAGDATGNPAGRPATSHEKLKGGGESTQTRPEPSDVAKSNKVKPCGSGSQVEKPGKPEKPHLPKGHGGKPYYRNLAHRHFFKEGATYPTLPAATGTSCRRRLMDSPSQRLVSEPEVEVTSSNPFPENGLLLIVSVVILALLWILFRRFFGNPKTLPKPAPHSLTEIVIHTRDDN